MRVMIRKVGLSILTLLLFASAVFAQSDAGKIRGVVKDENGEPVAFATVKIIQNGIIKGGANTDGDGAYSISPVTPGTYTVVASFAGQEKTYEGVNIITGKTKTLDIDMSTDVELDVVEVYEPIEFDQTTTIQSFDKQQVRETGYRNINAVVAIAAGATPNERSGGINMRGQRATGTTYFVDGVKMRGVLSLPQKSIEQINVITGGTPAEYGDMIGGVISITTAGPSYQMTGGAEILTSTLWPKPYVGLDPFGYSLAGLNASGPIISRYDSVNDYKKPLLGFMFAGEAEYRLDQSPSALGVFKVKDDVRADYQQNPMEIDEEGRFFRQRANFLSPNDIEKVNRWEHNDEYRLRATGRLDFQPVDNIIVKLGLTYEYIHSRNLSTANTLLAPEGNQLFEGTLFRGWLRFQQSFPGGKDSKVTNLFYMIQGDYNLYHREFMNNDHKRNLFDYGYIGQMNFDLAETYRPVIPGLVDDHNPNIRGFSVFVASKVILDGARAEVIM